MPMGGAGGQTVGLVVAAGGHGVRLGVGGPKQYVRLEGVPMLERTVAALEACERVDRLVVVVNPEDVEFCRREIVTDRFEKVAAVVGGGTERALSIRNGLRALAEVCAADYLGTHDGARPLVSCADIACAVDLLERDTEVDGVVLARPASDTVKVVDERGMVIDTPDRNRVWLAQTPQIFRREVLLRAYRRPDGFLARTTDDCSLVEADGGRVVVIPGSPENLKVTTPVDLLLAQAILREREAR